VWLSVEGKYGSFKVSIDSEGTWDYEEQQWKYQVRQTDGKLYENGKLVGEYDFNRKEKN
jgi:VCBS repeat-containing protein